MSVDDDTAEQALEDKYTKQIPPSPAGADNEDKRDAVTRHRENFLNVYKEGGDDITAESDEPDLSQGIRYKTTAGEEDSGFELKTSNSSEDKKPLIQEIGAKEATQIAEERKARA